MTTDKQKSAVHFCEQILEGCNFMGDINNYNDVSSFLANNLEYAKLNYQEACESYYSEFFY